MKRKNLIKKMLKQGKRSLTVLLLIFALSMLSACAEGAKTEKTSEETEKDTAEEAGAQDDEENTDPGKEDPKETENGSEKKHKDLSELVKIPEEETEPKEGETDREMIAHAQDFEEAFAQGDVENNGGYFVRVGGQVFMRLISPQALDAGATFGKFLFSDSRQIPSSLVCYDLTTHTWEELYKIVGNGKLFVFPGGFYIGDQVNGEYDKRYTWLIDRETGDQTVYCDGLPVGISQSGEILAVEKLTGQFTHLQLVKDGKMFADLGGESGTYQFCGFVGENLIAMFADENDHYELASVDAQGKETRLGEIPLPDVEGLFWYPEIGQFITGMDDLFYVGLGYYEGTGHFLADWQAITAIPGVADSLSVEGEAKAYEVEIDQEPHMYMDAKNMMTYNTHVPGDVWVSWDVDGSDLMYCENGYSDRVLIGDFILPAEKRADHLDTIVQDIIAFDETAFILCADVQEDEEYSIGWRTGYSLDTWVTCAIPFGEGACDADGHPSEIQFIQRDAATGE